MLQLPTVDAPIAHLTSSSMLSTDVDSIEVCLRSEDRKAELLLRKNHQATAWAIKAATSASFFSRASLIWLHQLQDRLHPDDKRLHQDIIKLLAAVEYTADASLDAAKFASWALTTSISSRRLLWLRNWRADVKSKWRLASAPLKVPTSLEKHWILSSLKTRTNAKSCPPPSGGSTAGPCRISQWPPFRTDSGPSGSYPYRPFSQGYDRPSERSSYRDRGRRQQQFKRPSRGSNTRPFRRGK